MSEDTVYKKIEVVGTSQKSASDAIDNAVEKARESVDNLKWFEVTETRGYIDNQDIEYQVTLKIGFELVN